MSENWTKVDRRGKNSKRRRQQIKTELARHARNLVDNYFRTGGSQEGMADVKILRKGQTDLELTGEFSTIPPWPKLVKRVVVKIGEQRHEFPFRSLNGLCRRFET